MAGLAYYRRAIDIVKDKIRSPRQEDDIAIEGDILYEINTEV
jgi:hypothetical protein